MKKLIFSFAFLLSFGIAAADAQSCSGASAGVKSCCAGKAAKAASADASIEKRQSEDGSISYVRKETDAQGNVRFVNVTYDEAANSFVNVAPKVAAAGNTPVATEGMVKKSCSAGEKKACCAGGASANKACCAKPGAGEKKSEQ